MPNIKMLKKQHYEFWPGLDGSSDGKDDEVLGNLNMQVQLQFGETLSELGIKPTEIFVHGNRELKMEDLQWKQLLQKLGFNKEGK